MHGNSTVNFKMVKKHVNLSIEYEKWDMAQRCGINCSEALELAISARLGQLFIKSKEDYLKLIDRRKELEHKIQQLTAELSSVMNQIDDYELRQNEQEDEKREQTDKMVDAIKASGFLGAD